VSRDAYPWDTLVPGDAGGSIRMGRLLKAAQELEVEKDMREKRKVRAPQAAALNRAPQRRAECGRCADGTRCSECCSAVKSNVAQCCPGRDRDGDWPAAKRLLQSLGTLLWRCIREARLAFRTKDNEACLHVQDKACLKDTR